MQQGNFVYVFLARHVSGTDAHHQEHQMLSCSIWFSAPSFWIGGVLESRCVGRVYGADGAMRLSNKFTLLHQSWHFRLFHEEDARSNNPHVITLFGKYFTFSAFI